MKLKRRIKLMLARRFFGFCTHLTAAVSIRSNGSIEPCACVGTEKEEEFIPLNKTADAVLKARNSEAFIATRRFTNGKPPDGKVFSICTHCVLKEHTRYPFVRFDTVFSALKGCSFSRKLKKMKNFVHLLYEIISKKERLSAYPIYANIDPVNACNLHCPFCIVGAGKDIFKPEFISIERYKNILKELGGTLLHLSLYRYGEPLMHPEIGTLISLAKEEGIYVHLSTNLLLLDEKKLKEVIEAEPDQIVVCADGVTEETYQKYRQGGNFAQFRKNLEMLLKAIRKSGKKIEVKWQYLVFGYNESEIEKAKQIAENLHIPFSAEPAYIPNEAEFNAYRPSSNKYRYKDDHEKEAQR